MRLPARRWRIVAALFAVTYGVSTPFAAFGVFLPVLADTFGWTRGAISTALSVNLLLGGVAGFGLGAVADRRGPRLVLALTVALAGVAFALVSVVSELWQLYLLVGVLGGIGMSSFYMLSAATVMRWFDERRGLALALVLMGFNLGYISAGPLAAWLVVQLGWRAAYALLSSVCGLVAVLAALTVRLPRPAEAPPLRRSAESEARTPSSQTWSSPDLALEAGSTLGRALGDPRYWCLNFAWLLLGGTYLMLAVHVVPFARDQGISLTIASLALSAYGVGAATGRIVAGAISDRLGTVVTIRAGYLVQVVALVGLLSIPSREMLLGSLAIFGVGFAASDTMITKAIPEVFGVRAIGAIMGILSLGWRCGAALGPAVAGFLYDMTGSYAIPFGGAPVAALTSWGLFALATASRRR